MIKPRDLLEKLLASALLFLLPSQLSYHFWPSSAFIYGIRVDYLAPTIYLTDILFIVLFVLWLKSNFRTLFKYLKRYRLQIFLFLLFVSVNIFESNFFVPTIFKWIKIIEMGLFAFYVFTRRDMFNSELPYKSFLLSLIFFSVIGIGQFINGHTLGGVLYFLGERSFNITTPGIALFNLFGRSVLRVYSTFPHPNVFAGYLSVMLIILATWYNEKFSILKSLTMMIAAVALVLTFSLSSVVGLAVCVVFLFCRSKIKIGSKTTVIFLSSLFLVSLLSSLVFESSLLKDFKMPVNYAERLELTHIAGSVFSKNPIIGSGLNTFIVEESGNVSPVIFTWLLQPVHNIYLLALSETGLVGMVFLYLIFYKGLAKSGARKKSFGLVIIFILVTGLFDHYWFTLQQTNLLLAFILGKIFSEQG